MCMYACVGACLWRRGFTFFALLFAPPSSSASYSGWNADDVFVNGQHRWNEIYCSNPDSSENSDPLEDADLAPARHCLGVLSSAQSPKPSLIIGYDGKLLTLAFENHISLMQTLDQRDSHRWSLLLLESNNEYDMDNTTHVSKAVSLLTTRGFIPVSCVFVGVLCRVDRS